MPVDAPGRSACAAAVTGAVGESRRGAPAGRLGRRVRPPSRRTSRPPPRTRAPARPRRGRRRRGPPGASSAAASAIVTSCRRGSRSRRSGSRSTRAPPRALPAVVPSTWSMSVSSAHGRQPGAARPPRRASRASSSAPVALGHEGAGAELDVHHERVEPGGELLGQDRGDDQRDRLDGAGGVADRVQAAVGGGEVGGLADDRAAGLAHRPARSARGRASCRSPGSRRACPACRRCGRGRGRRSSAPRRRTPRRSAPASATTLSPTPPVECLSSTGRSRSHCRTAPERVIAAVSATRSPASIPRRNDAPSRARRPGRRDASRR